MPEPRDLQPANAAAVYNYQRTMKALSVQPDNFQYDPSTLMLLDVNTSRVIDPLLHANKILQCDSATDITLTLPANAARGFTFMVDQIGVGKVIFAVAGAATKINRQNHDRTAGAGAQMSVYVRKNVAGNNAVYALAGDGAIS